LTGAAGAAAAFGATGAALPVGLAVDNAGAAAGALPKVGAGLPEVAAAAGPPGGNVGNLIVGAAEGFGGRLMRTVSFFGCTLPVSFLGGIAPVGVPGLYGGVGSDINFVMGN